VIGSVELFSYEGKREKRKKKKRNFLGVVAASWFWADAGRKKEGKIRLILFAERERKKKSLTAG